MQVVGGRTGVMQERRYEGKEGFRIGRMQVVGGRTGVMQERRYEGKEG